MASLIVPSLNSKEPAYYSTCDSRMRTFRNWTHSSDKFQRNAEDLFVSGGFGGALAMSIAPNHDQIDWKRSFVDELLIMWRGVRPPAKLKELSASLPKRRLCQAAHVCLYSYHKMAPLA